MENQTDQNKYKKYFIRDVVRGAMNEEWGDEMIREQGQFFNNAITQKTVLNFYLYS